MSKKKKKERSLARELRNWFLFLLLVICLILLAIYFVSDQEEVRDNAMGPALETRERVIVDRITYRFKDPSRFDVVIFPFKYQDGVSMMRRVIGLPGETVQISGGIIYINGNVLSDPYGKGTMTSGGLASEPITLGENEYFVLGDNRTDSSDSREPSVGRVQKNEIRGRAIFVVWPLDRLRPVK